MTLLLKGKSDWIYVDEEVGGISTHSYPNAYNRCFCGTSKKTIEPKFNLRPALNHFYCLTFVEENSIHLAPHLLHYQKLMMQQKQHPIYIGVMGMTGTGKSTFIKTLTNDPNVVVGTGLRSCIILPPSLFLSTSPLPTTSLRTMVVRC